MAGRTLDRKLTSTRTKLITFALATPADDAGLRRLLRENPLRGQIDLTLEREPDYFADTGLSGWQKQTIAAKMGDRVVCMGSCSVQERFVNGQPRRVGYLGGLRLDASVMGRSDILRRGYDCFAEQQRAHPADYYFTSIAADNERARSFLERGLPGMPQYEFVSEFVTLLLPVDQRLRGNPSLVTTTPSAEEIVDFVNEHNRCYQFAECWTVSKLQALASLGLRVEHFQGLPVDGRLAALGAAWDQRAFKQTVIRGYTPALKFARPWVNLIARWFGAARLPRVGTPLAQAFVSPLAVDPKRPEALPALLADLIKAVSGRTIEFLTLGFAEQDPRWLLIKNRFRCRTYVSCLYVVHWPGLGGSARELDGRLPGPEVAWL